MAAVTHLVAGTALRRWKLAALAAYVVGGVLAATWGPRLPELRAELQVSTAQIGLILVGSTVGLLLGLGSSSWMSRMLGIRRAIASSFGVIAVSMAGVALGVAAASPAAVVVALLVLGWGTGVIDVLVNVEGAAIEQLTGRSFLPLLHALWLGGAAVGAGIGAACSALGIASAWQFLAESVSILVIGAVVVAELPSRGPEADEVEREGEGLRVRVGRWLAGWTDRRLLVLGLLIFGVELAEGSGRTWLPSAVTSAYHSPDAVAALFVTLFSVGTAGFRAIGGPIVDRFGRLRVVRFTIAVGIVGLVLFILGGSLPIALAGTVLWSIGNCVAGPLAMSAAAEGGPGAVARVSTVASIGFCAGLAGPPVIGGLAQTTGLIPTFWLLVVFLIVALIATPALRNVAVKKPAMTE